MKVVFAIQTTLCLAVALCARPAAAQAPPASPARPGGVSVAGAFPEDARVAYVDLDRIVALSTEGKSINGKLQEFRSKKGTEVESRGKQVEALETKLASEILNDSARAQLQREFERAKIDFQRFSQDAQAEVQELQQQMQMAFGQKLFPVIGQIAKEKSLWAVFSADSLMLWHDPRLDISEEVARRLDATAAQPKP